MSILSETRPFPDIAARIHRRHNILTSGGMTGVMQVAGVLQDCGLPVRDFSVDVREGVAYGSLSCTISMTADEAQRLVARLCSVPAVIAVDPG
ncbi:hypothetical protein [Pseudonocardia asaccharolytica]|uniref:ACT domain-containing protein n=1 Tax=Pseudonocardia asaccharolytica DSM 44247 = NBRC 16224 TaxID=1123024 RepID=A0A511CY32_9PSEU|nr:hypothetical protein [Pseudonocardia asaccharolytica]GEL17153.1 hypothetical protein PA7_09900 [Pseudonocardia asaccharolytica DSM 44247 = NBRC 16224]